MAAPSLAERSPKLVDVPHVRLAMLAGGAGGAVALDGNDAAMSILPPSTFGATDLDGLARVWAKDWDGLRARLEAAVGKEIVKLDGTSLLAPIRAPRKMILVGMNYHGHCAEIGQDPPDEPLMLAKFPSSISGPTDDIVWSTTVTKIVDYEAELGVVVGATLKNASESQALGGILGYVAINDVSARDLQWHDGQWVRGKSLDTFCPIGPSLLVPLDRSVEPVFRLRTWVNGNLRQDDTTDNMIFGVARTLSYLSRSFTLEPGDVVLTGTPAGTARAHPGAGWLQDGDLVEVEVSGIGTLRNRCRVVD